MPVFIQIAGFLEVLVPDAFWIGLLTPFVFSMIGLAEAVGFLPLRGTTYTIELSVLLAYVGSITISHPSSRTGQQLSEPDECRNHASDLSAGTVSDAAE